jgi:hypothetical protein
MQDGAAFPGLGVGDVAFDQEHLCDMGEVDVLGCWLHSDRAAFGATVTAVLVGVYRNDVPIQGVELGE